MLRMPRDPELVYATDMHLDLTLESAKQRDTIFEHEEAQDDLSRSWRHDTRLATMWSEAVSL